MAVELAEWRRPDGSEELAGSLRELAERAGRGELVSMVFAAVRADGSWLTGVRGKPQETLVTVGLLEGMKQDCLDEGRVVARRGGSG